VRDQPSRSTASGFFADAATSTTTIDREAPANREMTPTMEAASGPFWDPRPYQPKSGSIDFVEDEFRRDRAFALPAVC
jgi:hypothetical protein